MNADIDNQPVTDLEMLLNLSDQITNGIIIGRGHPESLAAAKQRLMDQAVMSLSSSGPDNIEMIPTGIDKATAIRQIQMIHALMPIIQLSLGMGKMIWECCNQRSTVLRWTMPYQRSKRLQIM